MPQASTAIPSRQETFGIGKIFRTLWRGRLVLLLCALLASGAGGYYVYSMVTPVYTASTLLMLNTREEQVTSLDSVIGGLSNDASVINTEVEVLRSRELIGDVVDALNLIEDPEFNASLRPPTLKDQLRDTVRQFFPGKESPAPSIQDPSNRASTRDVVVSATRNKIRARNLQGSLVFSIAVDSTDPAKAARISDVLAEAYITDQITVKFEATEKATAWLTDRVSVLQLQLETAEQDVRIFKSEIDLVSYEQLKALEIQLKALRDRLRSTERSLEEAGAHSLKLQAATTREERAALTNDAILNRLLTRLEGSPVDQDTFDQRFETLLVQSALDVTRLDTQLAALSISFDEQNQNIQDQSSDSIELQQLEREASAIRLLYEYFLNRLNETAAQEGVQQADSRIISRAVIPSVPSSPDKSSALVFSGFLGVLFGSALLLFWEMRSSTFRAAEELEEAIGLPVFGQIPVLPTKARKRIVDYLNEKPTSAAAEAIRNLRTSLLLSNVDNPPKTMLVTSCVPGEGKSTISFALAQNLAQMGRKTLLIEGDIRRPVFAAVMDTEGKGSMADYVVDDAALDTLTFHEPSIGADILLAGEVPINAADFFSSQKFSKMLEQLAARYDHIVIDTPPILLVSDARIVANHVDASVFVVRWDTTSQHQVREAINSMENVDSRIIGFALNQINPVGMRKYGYTHNSHGYGAKYYTN